MSAATFVEVSSPAMKRRPSNKARTGTTALVGSVTEPLMLPVSVSARTVGAKPEISKTKASTALSLLSCARRQTMLMTIARELFIDCCYSLLEYQSTLSERG